MTVVATRMRSFEYVSSVIAILLFVPCVAMAETKTIVGFARAEARSSTWITVEAPFLGDEKENGYTVFRIGRSPVGPFTATSSLPAAGPSGWRGEVIPRLTPDTDYYIQVEYFDPIDGLIDSTGSGAIGPGRRLQVLGPIHTRPSAPLAVRVEPAIAESRTNEILVSVPISDDSNTNSGGTFELAEDIPGIPDSGLSWSQRCGPSGSIHPKLCRIRSLTPGRTYRIRVQVTDRDGVTGPATQVITGIRYTGGENVAFNKLISVSAPGWGCCLNPAEMTDGRIQYDDWPHGFAWPGGLDCYNGGCPAGDNKTATIDLGSSKRINRAVIWFHDAQSVVESWKIETSLDNVTYQQVYAANDPRCRAATFPLRTDWSFPACSHTASFLPVSARYVRYRFNDATLFAGLHGWVLELEVFQSGELTASPTRRDFIGQPVGTNSDEQTITLRNSGLSPVTLQAPRITPPGLFTVSNRCPAVLNMNASCLVGVRFIGAATSLTTPAIGALSVDHDGAGSPTVVQLTGTSVPVSGPLLTFSPSTLSLRFPPVVRNATSAAERLTLQNRGAPVSSIQAVSSSPSFVVTSNGCAGGLTTGSSCVINVAFAPTVAASFSEKLTVSWPGGGSEEIALIGSALTDVDGDGIPDAWESGEVTILGERINLSAMGAIVGVKDVFVELDYLQDAAHTHQPKPEAIKKVVDAYLSKGIALHVDCGALCLMNPATQTTWGSASRSNAIPHVDPITGSANELGFRDGANYNWTSFDEIKNVYLSPARSVIFRYGIFAHNLGGEAGTTGLARTQTLGDRKTASDFIVSLGATANFVGNVFEQAGTFMHELGHNLGLTHGGCPSGSRTCDQSAYKPNYLSVMNYLFQTRGLFIDQRDGAIDYSNSALPSLSEALLNEGAGLGNTAARFGTRYWCPSIGERPVLQGNGPIDWNCNGRIDSSSVSADIDATGSNQVLAGAEDWTQLVFAGGAIGQAGAPPPQPELTPIDELRQEDDQKITTIFGVSVTSGDSLRVPPGARGSLTFTIENRGSLADTFRIAVTPSPSVASWINASTVPAQISLPPLGTRVITIDVVTTALGGFGEVTLRASSVGNPNVFDVGRVAIIAGQADIAVTATDAPDPLLLGNRLSYSVVIQNFGPDIARDVQLNAELPAGLGSITIAGGVCLNAATVICNIGNLASGQRVAITVSGVPQATGILRALFRAAASTTDPNTANNASAPGTAVTGRPVLAAAVTGQARSGSELTLQVTFRNAGTEPAANVTVAAVTGRVLNGSGAVVVVRPAGASSLGNLQPGATVVLPITLSVPSTVTRLTLTQSGSVQDSRGATYSFSLAQGITP